jgi:chromosome segregation ATPase
MQGDIAQVRGDIAQFQGDIAQIQGDIAQIQGDIARFQGDMAQVRGDMNRVQNDLTQLRVAVMERIDRLQGALTLQRDELVVNFGAIERVERLARAAQEETRALGEMETPMIRQIRRLQDDVRTLRGET